MGSDKTILPTCWGQAQVGAFFKGSHTYALCWSSEIDHKALGDLDYPQENTWNSTHTDGKCTKMLPAPLDSAFSFRLWGQTRLYYRAPGRIESPNYCTKRTANVPIQVAESHKDALLHKYVAHTSNPSFGNGSTLHT